MNQDKFITFYASAERSEGKELNLQQEKIKKIEEFQDFLDAVPEVYLILNKNRQVIWANKAVESVYNLPNRSAIYGLRPGEIMMCENSYKNAAGCGTSSNCENCGAVNAILNSLNGNSDIQECSITNNEKGETADYRVWTKPYKIDDENFSIFSIADISHEKRRQALERIFFHDIINTAGSLKGYAELLSMMPDHIDEFKDTIYLLSKRIIDEINAQKELLAAENQELQPMFRSINSLVLIKDIANSYKKHDIVRDRKIEVDNNAEVIEFHSDETLISRIIGNMTKNALEACKESETVTLSCKKENDFIIFSVHNPVVIPKEIQLQIFQRSFSTKGMGRGLGTYSMKLLSERYLQGNCYFESNEKIGTFFYGKFPINPS